MMTSQTLLKQARDLLEDEDHWIKGEYCHVGAYCLVGALREAFLNQTAKEVATSFWWSVPYRSAMDTLATCIPRRAGFIIEDSAERVIDFNDNADTTYEDVVRALDCALEKASAGQ